MVKAVIFLYKKEVIIEKEKKIVVQFAKTSLGENL